MRQSLQPSARNVLHQHRRQTPRTSSQLSCKSFAKSPFLKSVLTFALASTSQPPLAQSPRLSLATVSRSPQRRSLYLSSPRQSRPRTQSAMELQVPTLPSQLPPPMGSLSTANLAMKVLRPALKVGRMLLVFKVQSTASNKAMLPVFRVPSKANQKAMPLGMPVPRRHHQAPLPWSKLSSRHQSTRLRPSRPVCRLTQRVREAPAALLEPAPALLAPAPAPQPRRARHPASKPSLARLAASAVAFSACWRQPSRLWC